MLTVDEFLEMEEASPTKHEYVGGQVYVLAGASERHNRIAGNIFANLWLAARNGPCRVYGSDMRLRLGESAVYYPDVQVVCDPDDSNQSYVTRPCLIVEVLSPSTQSIDLREKWLAYRELQSLQAYLIVWRDERRVRLHYRADDREWYDDLLGGESASRSSAPKWRSAWARSTRESTCPPPSPSLRGPGARSPCLKRSAIARSARASASQVPGRAWPVGKHTGKLDHSRQPTDRLALPQVPLSGCSARPQPGTMIWARVLAKHWSNSMPTVW